MYRLLLFDNNIKNQYDAIYYNCGKITMSQSIRIDESLHEQAKNHAKAERRTIAGQIEFWALVGKAALDNPDLPIDFVRDLLVAKAQSESELTPFVPEKLSK